MGGGLAFLSKKRFNPSNFSNQKRVWEAQQKKLEEEKRLKEREELLKKERGESELAIVMGGKVGGAKQSLRFMYAPPPGVAATDKNDATANTIVTSSTTTTFEDQQQQQQQKERHFSVPSEGDDEATKQFRLMFAEDVKDGIADKPESNIQQVEASEPFPQAEEVKAPAVVIDNRTKLEKEVGKLASSRAIPTLSEQMERFPQLKHAPMAVKRTAAVSEGVVTDNIMCVQFKPMGGLLRNVRCFKCGIWGHSVGDRECKLTGWNPFDIATDSNGNKTTESTMVDTCNRQQQEPAISQEECFIPKPKKHHTRKEKKRSRKRRRDYGSDSSQSDLSSSENKRRESRNREPTRRRKHKKKRSQDYSSDDDSHSVSSASSRRRDSSRRRKSMRKEEKRRKERRRRRNDDSDDSH